MQWAFWRRPAGSRRALPDDVGLPTGSRPLAAAQDETDDHRRTEPHPTRRSAPRPADLAAAPQYRVDLPEPAPDVDRTALAAAGPAVAARVGALVARTPAPSAVTDERTLAVAATGALAGRLPALSGADDPAAFDEPADELLHAYAELLAGRASARSGTDREDLLAVAHLAAAAVAIGAAADPALLLLAGTPAGRQLTAATVLLAQTAADGGGPPDRLPAEVRALFLTSG